MIIFLELQITLTTCFIWILICDTHILPYVFQFLLQFLRLFTKNSFCNLFYLGIEIIWLCYVGQYITVIITGLEVSIMNIRAAHNTVMMSPWVNNTTMNNILLPVFGVQDSLCMCNIPLTESLLKVSIISLSASQINLFQI